VEPDAELDASPDAPEPDSAAGLEMLCHVEARISGCGLEPAGGACEEVQSHATGRGRDRPTAEAAALGSCRSQLAEVWRTSRWPRILLARPCEVVSCGPAVLDGRPPRPRVRLTRLRRIEGDGVLREDEARTLLRGAMGHLVRCYESVLERAPATTGRLELRLSVDRDGRVTEARVASSLDPELVRCVPLHFETLRLAPPGSEMVLATEILFRPLGEPSDPDPLEP
jgi:hypothetical protein